MNIYNSLFHLARLKFTCYPLSPTYSPSHPVTTSTFFADFADYLETLILSTEPLVITGDFNVHDDDSTNPDATRLLDLLDSMGLCQHVTQPTHELGHTIDLIITRQSDLRLAYHGSSFQMY